MKEQQITSSLIQLRSLVAGLYGRIDALRTAPAPTVDFAVDMFDRQDQDTLGSYWPAPGYVIRSGAVLRSSGAVTTSVISSAAAYVFYNGQVLINSSVNHTVAGIPSAIASSVYSANISSKDFTCEVTSTVRGSPVSAPPVAVVNGAIANSEVSPGASTNLPIHTGVCIANSSDQAEGFAIGAFTVPPLSAYAALTPGSVVASISYPGGVGLRSSYGSGAAVTPLPPIPRPDVSGADVRAGGIHDVRASYGVFATMGIAAVNNLAKVVASGDLVTMTFNGVTAFSGVPSAVSKKSRARAGIMTPDSSMVAAVVTYPGREFGGITSFKVWRNDIPVPPDESGHGTYVNGRWQYTDKYHTANKDADGNIIRNEDGTVASYTYDPEA